MNVFFNDCNWDVTFEGSNIHQAESKFLDIYQRGIIKFIPKIKYQSSNFKDKDKWLDRDCILIINKKKIAWNRYRRRKTTLRYENYTGVLW